MPHRQLSQLYVQVELTSCLWLSNAQGGERALLVGGTGEDKQDFVSLLSQVLFPSLQDPALVSLHFESNAFCVLLDTVGLLL